MNVSGRTHSRNHTDGICIGEWHVKLDGQTADERLLVAKVADWPSGHPICNLLDQHAQHSLSHVKPMVRRDQACQLC